MNVGSAFIRALIATLDVIFSVITTIVFVWVVLSWFLLFAAGSSLRWRHPKFFLVVVRLEEILSRIVAPLLRPFRRLLPPWKTGGIDWSPMLLLLAIFFVRYFLAQLMF